MSLNGNNILAGASGQGDYEIEKSVVLGDSAKFTRTPSSAGNRKTWTWSGWVKRGKLETNNLLFSSADSSVRQWFGFYNNNLWFDHTNGSYVQSDALYRDVGSWYHIVVAWDTTQSTDTNRIKIYVNGEQISLTVGAWPALNQDGEINNTSVFTLGNLSTYSGYYFDGELAEVNFIDGTALDASSFGETNADTNQWVPKKYSGSYGTNGFYLDFATRATDPIDASGNGNNWSSSNVLATDWRIDTPTNNFCTFNPLGISTYNKWNTASEGNLKLYGTGDNFGESTFHLSSGKWYFEVDLINSYGKDGTYITLAGPNDTYLSGSFDVRLLNSVGTGDNPGLYGVSVDMDTGSWSTTRNGSAFGSGSFTPQDCKIGICNGNGAFAEEIVLNFGQDSSFAGNRTAQGNTDGNGKGDFYYTPPSGYLALCTDNLPDPSIADPTAYFNTVTYSGNSSTQAITGVGHQPDLTWFKARNNAYDHSLVDSVRGVNKAMASNTTSSESGFGTNYTIDSFDSDGFTLHSATYNNASGTNYVAWNWKAGGTASSNTDGTITSSVSANTTAGFSIVSYTGTGTAGDTVGHGLSQAPETVIIKKRESNGADGARGWRNWYSDLTDGNFLAFHSTSAQFGSRDFGEVGSGTYPYTAPTASTIYLGGSATGQYQETNYSGDTYIMYCFHGVDGFSKVGSYSGNSSDDGVFIHTGFRPAFVLIKCYAGHSSQEWVLLDNQRPEYNVVNKFLYANASDAEGSNARNVDFVSNGIKMRSGGTSGTGGPVNISGRDYTYLAFAESPFKYSNAR